MSPGLYEVVLESPDCQRVSPEGVLVLLSMAESTSIVASSSSSVLEELAFSALLLVEAASSVDMAILENELQRLQRLQERGVYILVVGLSGCLAHGWLQGEWLRPS